jgi:hypothetical protein
VVDVPTLDERDQGTRDVGTLRHVLLPPAAMESNGSERSADAHVIHRAIVACAASQTLSGR